MLGGANRIAHVVEAIEYRDEVESLPGESMGAGDFETHAI